MRIAAILTALDDKIELNRRMNETLEGIAGIVGRNKLIYDVWGETVNIASFLKSNCPNGAIVVSTEIYKRLCDIYSFEALDLKLDLQRDFKGESDRQASMSIPAWRLVSGSPKIR